MKSKLLYLRNFFLVLLAGLILSACNKEKEETPSDLLVGTWTVSPSTTFTVMIGTKTLIQYCTDVLGLNASEAQLFANIFNQQVQQYISGTIQIKSDGTYTANIGGETDTGTWSLSGDGKKLTIDSSEDLPMTFDIIELTSSKLHFKMTETQSEDLNEDGTPETITITVDYIFTK